MLLCVNRSSSQETWVCLSVGYHHILVLSCHCFKLFINAGTVTGLPRSWKSHGISGILKFSGISGKVMEF